MYTTFRFRFRILVLKRYFSPFSNVHTLLKVFRKKSIIIETLSPVFPAVRAFIVTDARTDRPPCLPLSYLFNVRQPSEIPWIMTKLCITDH